MKPNLAAVVTEKAVKAALNKACSQDLNLIPATKFHIIYRERTFPPKEIVRLAAKNMGIHDLENYRLNGGEMTNAPLRKLGFIVEPFNNFLTAHNKKAVTSIKQKIARLTYNSNGWVYPSGWEGKAKTDSYESNNGYGHEEWLLDFSKLIDGDKYGFLEPINKNLKKYIGSKFDIFLYTINSKTKEKSWVGKLNNVEVISPERSEEIKAIYQKKGWYREMKDDLDKLDLNSNNLDQWSASSLFNIRFKQNDFEKFPERSVVAVDDNSVTSYHYVLLNVMNKPKIIKEADGKFILGRCNPNSRHEATTISKKFEEKIIEYPFIHHQISKALEKMLRRNFEEVYAENQTGFKTSIDLVAKKDGKINFYEIKTYNDVRTCIRLAIGQLLEYSYFPDKQIADEIFIVTPHEIIDKNMIAYIKNLRVNVGLPINYICFDVNKKKIIQTI